MRASEELRRRDARGTAGPSALRPGPAALDLPPPALYPGHARPLLREYQPGARSKPRSSGWKTGSPACPPRTRQDTRPGRRIRKALLDNLETCRGRLENLHKAKENCELVEAEIARLENKIRSITEMAINRQDPQFVSGQVDQVAASLVHTEETMNDLRFATGLDPIDDAAPSIIPRGAALEPAPPVQDIAPPRPRTRQTEDGIYYN